MPSHRNARRPAKNAHALGSVRHFFAVPFSRPVCALAGFELDWPKKTQESPSASDWDTSKATLATAGKPNSCVCRLEANAIGGPSSRQTRRSMETTHQEEDGLPPLGQHVGFHQLRRKLQPDHPEAFALVNHLPWGVPSAPRVGSHLRPPWTRTATAPRQPSPPSERLPCPTSTTIRLVPERRGPLHPRPANLRRSPTNSRSPPARGSAG